MPSIESLMGLYPSFDRYMVGRTAMGLRRDGARLDRSAASQGIDPFAPGPWSPGDFAAPSAQELAQQDLNKRAILDRRELATERDRFDREFYQDPKTGEWRNRRAPSHTDEASGRSFTLLGDGVENPFRLDESVQPTVAGRVGEGFNFLQPSPEITQEPTNPLRQQDPGLFSAPQENFIGEVGPTAEPKPDALQESVLAELTKQHGAGRQGIQDRVREMEVLTRAVESGKATLSQAREMLSQEREQQAQAEAKQLEGFHKDLLQATSKKTSLMAQIRRAVDVGDDGLVDELRPELAIFANQQRRLLEMLRGSGAIGGAPEDDSFNTDQAAPLASGSSLKPITREAGDTDEDIEKKIADQARLEGFEGIIKSATAAVDAEMTDAQVISVMLGREVQPEKELARFSEILAILEGGKGSLRPDVLRRRLVELGGGKKLPKGGEQVPELLLKRALAREIRRLSAAGVKSNRASINSEGLIGKGVKVR